MYLSMYYLVKCFGMWSLTEYFLAIDLLEKGQKKIHKLKDQIIRVIPFSANSIYFSFHFLLSLILAHSIFCSFLFLVFPFSAYSFFQLTNSILCSFYSLLIPFLAHSISCSFHFLVVPFLDHFILSSCYRISNQVSIKWNQQEMKQLENGMRKTWNEQKIK